MARALFVADFAARALVKIKFVSLAGTQLDNCVLRTGSVTPVTLKTISAREASLGFEQSFGLRKVLHYLVETCTTSFNGQTVLLHLRRIRPIPEMQTLVADNFVARRAHVFRVFQKRIDMPGCMFAMTDGNRHGTFARHHVTARENALVTGHHVVVDDDGMIPFKLDTGHRLEKGRVGILTQGEDE